MLTAQLSASDPVATFAALLLLKRKQPTRYATIEQLRGELGNTEQTAIFLDYLKDCWKTLDQLTDKVGAARALTILLCGFCLPTLSEATIMSNAGIQPSIPDKQTAETKEQKLEELLREALDIMSLIDPGQPASSKWRAARDRLIVQAQSLLHPDMEETYHECTTAS